MKRILRLALITVLVLSLCLCLTGCNMIEDMRAAHAILQEDGSVLLDGKKYIELPFSETLSPRLSDVDAYVTTEDVPVLLSAILGDTYQISEDGVFLQSAEDYSGLGITHYCRSDKYDAVKEQIENGFTSVGYMYTYEVLTDPDLFEFEEKSYTLTAQEQETLDIVYRSVDPNPLLDELMFDYSAYICRYSEDTYFSEDICIVYYLDGNYYVSDYQENVYGSVRLVPDYYNDIFAGIMKKAIESADSWNAYYEQYYGEDYDAAW